MFTTNYTIEEKRVIFEEWMSSGIYRERPAVENRFVFVSTKAPWHSITEKTQP